MSYQGYRLKINNITVPENHIGRGSYNLHVEDRIIDEWTDGDRINHVSSIGSKRHTITFSLRQHASDEHATFLSYVAQTKNIPVQYYDDMTDTYKTGSFHIEGIDFAHQTVRSGMIWYDDTPVILEEY